MKRTHLAAASVAVLAAGSLLSAAPAHAATTPALQVALTGNNGWTLSWDASTSPLPPSSCSIWRDGQVSATGKQAKDSAGFTDGTFPAGAHKFQVRCDDDSVSTTVTIYTPRNPINDLRTQFSSATQGSFGS